MQFNKSIQELHIHCTLETKTKFSDTFVQSLCKSEISLPVVKIVLHSKMHFGYNSTQKLLQSLDCLDYLGPLEMLPKLSKGDVADLVIWIKENNMATVLQHNARNENVFHIEDYNPWKYKYVPDVGRIPKPGISKRTLSCISFFTGIFLFIYFG